MYALVVRSQYAFQHISSALSFADPQCVHSASYVLYAPRDHGTFLSTLLDTRIIIGTDPGWVMVDVSSDRHYVETHVCLYCEGQHGIKPEASK